MWKPSVKPRPFREAAHGGDRRTMPPFKEEPTLHSHYGGQPCWATHDVSYGVTLTRDQIEVLAPKRVRSRLPGDKRAACVECGNAIEWSGRGRPKLYCSTACKNKRSKMRNGPRLRVVDMSTDGIVIPRSAGSVLNPLPPYGWSDEEGEPKSGGVPFSTMPAVERGDANPMFVPMYSPESGRFGEAVDTGTAEGDGSSVDPLLASAQSGLSADRLPDAGEGPTYVKVTGADAKRARAIGVYVQVGWVAKEDLRDLERAVRAAEREAAS